MTDPLGNALDYFLSNPLTDKSVIIHSEQFDDFEIPLKYFFRTETEMPSLEIEALNRCSGRVLDIGGGAGCHAIWLKNKGFEVESIDSSKKAVAVMKKLNIQASQEDFWNYKPQQKFDTILMLMNGLGIMGKIINAKKFFEQMNELLSPEGQILVDSSDLIQLYTEDGEAMIELSDNYLGESRFCFEFDGLQSDWFDWIYLDSELLNEISLENGFNCELIAQYEDGSYLAKLCRLSSK